MLEQLRCVACDRELIHFGPGASPERCEDCIPQTGPGSPFHEQVVTNLHRLRLDAGLSLDALAERAAMRASDVSQLERGAAGEPGVMKALRLAHSLGVPIDALVERVYWDRGEVAASPGKRRPASERLAGFFHVLPPNVPLFEPAAPRPIRRREEAAHIVGRNVREARERRHRTQVELAEAAGLSKSGLSLIERGIRETTLGTLLSLARALEVTPGFLFRGLAWEPQSVPPSECRGARQHPEGDLDGPIKRMWEEGKTARQIGEALGIPIGSVSAIVHRLRERGVGLRHRRRPTTPSQRQARRRRRDCRPAQGELRVETPDAVDSRRGRASHADVGARIASNLQFHRLRAGLTFRQLGEATETDHTFLYRIEKSGHTPQLSLIVKLAGSLNVTCEIITSGIVWEPTSRTFGLVRSDLDDREPPAVLLGREVLRTRRRFGLSQQALADRAGMSRSEVSDFERGKRDFRLFFAVRIAGAFEVDVTELFSALVDWYVRPLPAPEYANGARPPSKAERDALLVQLWHEGQSEREIAETLELSVSAVGPYVRELRDAGRRLPYRRPPRGVVEISARRRRAARSPVAQASRVKNARGHSP
jgi:transcriptional regulator with XRE-family HTH domain